jgi:hypothetical protein
MASFIFDAVLLSSDNIVFSLLETILPVDHVPHRVIAVAKFSRGFTSSHSLPVCPHSVMRMHNVVYLSWFIDIPQDICGQSRDEPSINDPLV